MKIGIIGGGAAGLFSAWLLEKDHEVTIFEKDDRFGGHAQTIDVDLDGSTYHVDAGIHYFSERLQPTFMRLLDEIDAPVVPYNPSSTFVDLRDGWTVCMPPWGNFGRITASARPRTLTTLMQLQRLIQGSISLVEGDGDHGTTLEDFVGELGLSPAFINDFVFPYLCSFWGVSKATVRGYSARNALSYLVLARPPVITPLPICEMAGGMQAYIDLLVAQFSLTRMRCTSEIKSLKLETDQYQIVLADNSTEEFDHIIVATNAEQARAIIRDLPHAEPVQQALAGVKYFDTTIAIHSDTSLLPQNPAHWSVVNGRFDGEHCSITDRAHANRDVNLFRSWITHDVRMPEPCHAEIAFRHPHPNPAYFQAQKDLVPLQGQQNLWFAGMYVTHYDNHEGALLSAMSIADTLAPKSERLNSLR